MGSGGQRRAPGGGEAEGGCVRVAARWWRSWRCGGRRRGGAGSLAHVGDEILEVGAKDEALLVLDAPALLERLERGLALPRHLGRGAVRVEEGALADREARDEVDDKRKGELEREGGEHGQHDLVEAVGRAHAEQRRRHRGRVRLHTERCGPRPKRAHAERAPDERAADPRRVEHEKRADDGEQGGARVDEVAGAQRRGRWRRDWRRSTHRTQGKSVGARVFFSYIQ